MAMSWLGERQAAGWLFPVRFMLSWPGMNWLEQSITRQRAALNHHLESRMAALAWRCAEAWGDADLLDRLLADSLAELPACRLLYAVGTNGVQVSSNIAPDQVNRASRGGNLSGRPFLISVVPCRGVLLSEVYFSQVSRRPCITALHTVADASRVLGFVAADFELRDLPLLEKPRRTINQWRQIRGDPAIRGTMFQQKKARSPMDERIGDVISIMDELICARGVFHGKLHFSSSRATLWLTADPYRYRLHVLDEIIDPAVCMAYPSHPYPSEATVPARLVRPVLERFHDLREADETVYLRSASLNVINGMVGLNFSCDGSHYMGVREFLGKDDVFWFGS